MNSVRQQYWHISKENAVFSEDGQKKVVQMAPKGMQYNQEAYFQQQMIADCSVWIPCVPMPKLIDSKL